MDEDVVQRVDDLGPTSWSGEAYRHTSRGRDPLSGVGARLFGGRWNPRDVFPTIYLAQPLATCIGEFDRLAVANSIDPLAMLKRPHELHTVTATDLQILDLREEKSLSYVGLAPEDIADDDRTACQAVGHAAWFLQMSGVVAPSATGKGLVIAVFENRLRPGQLRLERTTELDENTYGDARSGALELLTE
ncbi:MAG TPA: RES domain-containing protein [Actinomycetes bacterium]|nr:RES domain-containing protein [Actinomycetes bacterium]